MFKKFTTEDVSTQNQIKSSIQRSIRGAHCLLMCSVPPPLQHALPIAAAKIIDLYPIVEEQQIIDAVLPKKEQAALAKLCGGCCSALLHPPLHI